MQQAELGEAVADVAPLMRGDLIFWKGHVGLMLDSTRIIHANGYFMRVSVEPLVLVRERTRSLEGVPVRTIKRL